METVDCKRWFVRERNSQENEPENLVKVEDSQGKHLRIREETEQVRGAQASEKNDMSCIQLFSVEHGKYVHGMVQRHV